MLNSPPPPPPPPPPLISFFMQDLRDFRGWQLQLRGILPSPPPPKQTPWRCPCWYVLCMTCPTSCPSPTQLHSTPPYPTTCTVTSPRTSSNTTTITIPHHVSNANNTSTILAKRLAENCASPDNGTQRGGGDSETPTHFFFFDRNLLWQNYYHNGVGVLSSSPYVTELTSKKKKRGEKRSKP